MSERTAPLPLLWQHRADLRIGWIEKVEQDARGLRGSQRVPIAH